MTPGSEGGARLRVSIGYQVDADYSLAQHAIVREVAARLDAERFHLTAFFDQRPDPRLVVRPNTRLIKLPGRLKTAVRLRHLLSDRIDRCWYLAPEPSSYLYLRLRPRSNRAVTSIEAPLWSDAYRSVPPAVRRYARTLVDRSERLTSVSRGVAEGVLDHYGRRSDVVPVGVDADLFRPGGARGTGEVNVLYVGSFNPWKCPGLVLDAAGRFPDTRFTLVGQGPLGPELERRAHESGLENVRILPPVPHPELAEIYREADVFFFPSTTEGLPKVLLEASASGLPSVLFAGYRQDAVEDGVGGFVARSDAELMTALERLIHDPAERRRMGAAARAQSLAFGWDAIARTWERILSEPLSDRQR